MERYWKFGGIGRVSARNTNARASGHFYLCGGEQAKGLACVGDSKGIACKRFRGLQHLQLILMPASSRLMYANFSLNRANLFHEFQY
jgi:hypothetical protein